MQALFTGTLDGLFKVVRTKQGWDIRSRHLAEMEVNALANHPMQRQVIFAGVRGGGLYRNDDMGENWECIGAEILSEKIRALALDPSNADTVYVGTGGERHENETPRKPGSSPAGFMSSTDYGRPATVWLKGSGFAGFGAEKPADSFHEFRFR